MGNRVDVNYDAYDSANNIDDNNNEYYDDADNHNDISDDADDNSNANDFSSKGSINDDDGDENDIG